MTAKLLAAFAVLIFSAAPVASAHIQNGQTKPARCFPTGNVSGNIAICDQYSEHLNWRLTCAYTLTSHHGTIPSVCRLTPADNPNGLMIQLSLRKTAPEIFLQGAQPAQIGAFVVDDKASSTFVTQNDPVLSSLDEVDSFNLIHLFTKGRSARLTFEDRHVKPTSAPINLMGFGHLLIQAVRFLQP